MQPLSAWLLRLSALYSNHQLPLCKMSPYQYRNPSKGQRTAAWSHAHAQPNSEKVHEVRNDLSLSDLLQ